MRGLQLSDHGLAPRAPRGVAETAEAKAARRSLPCASEADVFAALGLPYRSPTERNVYDIANLDPDAVAQDREREGGGHGDDGGRGDDGDDGDDGDGDDEEDGDGE